MLEGTINPVPMACRACEYGVVMPRISSYTDRMTEDIITEAEWVCPRCGSRFASGIVSKEPKQD